METTDEAQTRLSTIEAVAAICNGKDLKAASRAASSLGFLAFGDRSAAILEAIAKALLNLSSKKGDELQFAVGEAFCFSFGGECRLLDARVSSILLSISLPKTSLHRKQKIYIHIYICQAGSKHHFPFCREQHLGRHCAQDWI